MNDRLFTISNKLLNSVSTEFQRFLFREINWDWKLVGVSGARGSGKTIMMLQQLDKVVKLNKKGLYVTLDDIYFTENNLIDFALDFEKNGGEYLFIDEVHKYKNWSQELKNIYDFTTNLKVVFTSSSALEIYRGSHDLSRRALVYKLKGLSFREFLELKYGYKFNVYNLDEILNNHNKICIDINKKIKVIPLFKEYLKNGYYPFFVDLKDNYLIQLNNIINTVIETDLPAIYNIDFNSIIKIKKLLAILSDIVPYKPNIEKLAKQIATTRPTLLKYLYYLDKAQVIQWLGSDSYGINYLNKPDKLYLGNTNIAHAVSKYLPNEGNLRETFVLSQLAQKHTVSYSSICDFMVDDNFLLEVGGRSKNRKQIAGLENAYLVKDNIEFGFANSIPIWLLGFIY